ncbi:RNA 2',3'-cyclic phosphodiesterase [Parahaliea aestuarii]|uniref:RNA 2',3'-cyclic phosphodiesterase n=1 Tax=Parahaliea aestuarii TaxID=1852021 RepID=A0A5C8ZXF4_9GAMM|nr:RNA 2',3'-cyclic phosphodiesterase [Parahaliea aestuarii]TXS92282.1 RNA 2',3'-cyclic phosphodiesterase [Parahaliea aestuarii]
MRVFFGIEPDQPTALAIDDWRERQFSAAARPVPLANLHLTLAFGGELPLAAIDELCDRVDAWLSDEPPGAAQLLLDQTGFWPGNGIYWLGPSHWPDALDRQAGKLRQLLASAGARRDRQRFQPHITLFRRCEQAPPLPAQPPAIALQQREISLYESQRQREGVAYHVVAAWPLPQR